MASVTGFSFYDNPATHAGPTAVTVDPAAQTWTAPGLTAIPFAKTDEIVASLRSLLNQDTSDGVVDPGAIIFKDDGTPLCTLTTQVVNGTPPVVTGIQAGVVYGKTKGLDLADGLDEFVLGL